MPLQRRKRANWLKYEQASRIAREAGCTSRKSYWDWWNAARPNNIPKMPQRVYKEWTTWGEFLGNNNVFQKYDKGSYRPYWEAVRWAQATCHREGLTRSIDWLHWYDDNERSIPEDIPKNAHYHYAEQWQGWATWLGTNIQGKVDAAKQELSVFALCTSPHSANNVLQVVVAKSGISELKEVVAEHRLNVSKAYAFDREQAATLQSIMQACARQQPDGTFIAADLNNLFFELSTVVDEVNLRKV